MLQLSTGSEVEEVRLSAGVDYSKKSGCVEEEETECRRDKGGCKVKEILVF